MKNKVFSGILIFLFMVVTTISLSSTMREKVKNLLMSSNRSSLASLELFLESEQLNVKVIKFEENNNIIVSVYSLVDNKPELLTELTLEGRKDGLTTINQEAVRLASVDVDGDGQKEIVVPTFDQNMDARLNVFKYNHANRILEAVSSDSASN